MANGMFPRTAQTAVSVHDVPWRTLHVAIIQRSVSRPMTSSPTQTIYLIRCKTSMAVNPQTTHWPTPPKDLTSLSNTSLPTLPQRVQSSVLDFAFSPQTGHKRKKELVDLLTQDSPTKRFKCGNLRQLILFLFPTLTDEIVLKLQINRPLSLF